MKEDLFKDLVRAEIEFDRAISASNYIHNNKGSYHYTASVPYPHKLKTGIGKITWRTVIRYRNESRFNQKKFDEDLALAKQNAEAKKKKITEIVSNLVQIGEDEEAEIRDRESLVNKDCALQQTNINSLNNSLTQLRSSNNALSHKINEQMRGLQNLKSQTNQAESQILNINKRIMDSQQIHTKNQETIKDLQEQVLIDLDTKNAKEAEIYQQIQNIVESMNVAHRTDVLIKLWGKKDNDAKEMVKLILERGFDINYQDSMGHSIITTAVIKGDMELFELILEKFPGFDLEIPTINGQTLFEYALTHEKPQFIEKILNSGGSFNRTVLRALRDDNETVMQKLLSYDASVIEAMHKGNSLLHLAIMSKKIGVMNIILKADSAAVEKVNFKGDTCFIAALRCGEKEIIKTLLEHVDTKEYMLNLISKSEIDLLCTLVETSPGLIDSLKPEILYKLICEKQFELTEMMLDYGFDLSPVMQMIIANDNKEALFDVCNMDIEYIINCNLDKQMLVKKCNDWGYLDIAHKITNPITTYNQTAEDKSLDTNLAGCLPDPSDANM